MPQIGNEEIGASVKVWRRLCIGLAVTFFESQTGLYTAFQQTLLGANFPNNGSKAYISAVTAAT